MTLSLTGETLLESERFRRALAWSAGAHVALALFALIAPHLRAAPRAPDAVFVDLVALPAPASPAPAPRQVVEEPVVIPERPKPAPPKPKPEPEVKPAPKPEAPPAPTYDQVIAQLRQSAATRPAPEEPAPAATGAPGRVDAELARYSREVQQLIYARWTGAKAFADRPDLEVQLEVSVSGGRVRTRLLRSSGVRALDESAARAVAKVRPFPPPPGNRTVILHLRPGVL